MALLSGYPHGRRPPYAVRRAEQIRASGPCGGGAGAGVSRRPVPARSDAVDLVVTTDPMTDATGRAYGGPLAPDEPVPMPARWWPSSADAVARRAAAWVLAETGCAAGR